MEEAAVMMTGSTGRGCRRGSRFSARTAGGDRTAPVAADYDVPNVSEKVVRIILSYTDYVRRVVWREPRRKRLGRFWPGRHR